jgi:hypothetical protein
VQHSSIKLLGTPAERPRQLAVRVQPGAERPLSFHPPRTRSMVIDVSKKHFPQMAIGYSDPRVKVPRRCTSRPPCAAACSYPAPWPGFVRSWSSARALPLLRAKSGAACCSRALGLCQCHSQPVCPPSSLQPVCVPGQL